MRAVKTVIFCLLAALFAGMLCCALVKNAGSADSAAVEWVTAEALAALTDGAADAGTMTGTLYLDGVEAPYDKTTNTYYIPQSMDTADWAGELTVQGAARACLGVTAPKAAAIASGQAFTLFAFTDAGAETASVVFTGMPLIAIDAAGEPRADTKLGCRMRVFDTPAAGGAAPADVTAEVKLHGNSSLEYEKKSLHMLLPNSLSGRSGLSLLGLDEDTDWVVGSLYVDKSRLREKLCWELWAELCAADPAHNYSLSHMRYAEVILNGRYYGLCSFMEFPDETRLPMDTENDMLYKVRAPINTAEELKNALLGIRSTAASIVKSPAWMTAAAASVPLRTYADAMLFDTAAYSPADRLASIDLENQIDLSLFYQICTSRDSAFTNNYYWAQQGDGGRVFRLMPWDLDTTWGRDYQYVDENPDLIYEDFSTVELKQLLRDDPALGRQVAARWFELREGPFEREAILARMERIDAALNDSGALTREMSRWRHRFGQAYSGTAHIRAFFEKRLAYLDAYYADMLGESVLSDS